MKTELMQVTPKMARDWLDHNTDNRPLRPFVVEGLMESWAHGEWKVTHQGIAFAKSGRLLDGQHRLNFIAQLPDGTKVPMNVTDGMDENSFDAIDIGIRRSMSDMYGVSADFVAASKFMAKIYNSNSTAGLSNQFTKPFLDWIEPEFVELTTYCPTRAKIWSSAPVRCAAIVQMKRGHDSDFIKLAYHSLVTADFDSMPHAARALMKQHLGGKIHSARTSDLFVRALRAFESNNNRKISAILIKDQGAILEEVRAWITVQVKKSPGSAGQVAVKPSAKFTWKKAA